MRVFAFVVVLMLVPAPPAAAQWSTPFGIVVARTSTTPTDVVAPRPQRITWVDFSSGLLGALIGVLIATTLCDDEPERSCPAGTPAIGGAVGAAVGIAIGRVAGRR